MSLWAGCFFPQEVIPAWKAEFLNKLIEDRSTLPYEDFNLYVDERIDLFSQADLELFDRARVNVSFGVERLDPSVLRAMGKTRSPAHYIACIDRVLGHPDHALHQSHHNIMMLFGFPSETRETVEHTAAVLENITQAMNAPTSIQGMFFSLLPSTEVYNNRETYQINYGSHLCFPSWWWEDLGVVKSTLNTPSRQLSFFELHEWFVTRFADICEEFHDKSGTMGAPPYFESNYGQICGFFEKCRRMKDGARDLIAEICKKCERDAEEVPSCDACPNRTMLDHFENTAMKEELH
ncbi:MAG TPA: hypothetical protein VKK79_00845 [Candidatus Lokiarchaeia archaeon]|nr:hypothetical protein [Candidatus Lokiarchaeia archaeon]